MTQKIADLAIRTGSYQKGEETKGRYETIGTLFQGEDGGNFITLKPHINLFALWQLQRMDSKAGGNEARDTLMVSCFTEDGRGSVSPAKAQETDFDDVAF